MDGRLVGLAGNILGGYLLGQQQREKRLEDAKIEKEKLKLLMDSQKIKDAKEARELEDKQSKSAARQKLADAYLVSAGLEPFFASQQGGENNASGLQYDDTFGEQSSAKTSSPKKLPTGEKLVDFMMNNQMLSQIFKEETGFDFPAMVEARRKLMADDLDRTRFEWDKVKTALNAGAGSYGQRVDPNTFNVYETFRPTNPAAAAYFKGGLSPSGPAVPPVLGGGGAPPAGLGVRPPVIGGGGGGGGNLVSAPKPEAREEVKDGVKYKYFVNPYNNQEVPGSRTIMEEKPAMSGEAVGRAGMVQSSLESFNKVKELLFPDGKLRDDWKMVVGLGNIGVGKLKPESNKYETHITNALTAKLRLETGANMPASEEKNLNTRFRPSSFDPPELVKDKLDNLENFLHGSIEMLDPNKRYSKDTLVVRDEKGKQYAWTPGKPGEKSTSEIPPEAIEKLKEGVVTVFGNGKKWTLQNGQPKQVQ